ncbi:MAG: 4-(cytidine 5'-diphospho)-2-C-methyl-D-erythritol kinase, partial [Chloroflexota bacterium]
MEAGVRDPLRRLTPVVRVAPAKLNLTLAVVGARSDGYHDLHSVAVPIGLADRLSLAPAPPGSPDTVRVVGPDTGPPADNLVLRAIDAVRALVPRTPFGDDPAPPLAVRLEKRIPVAAGLGGGSSDAAAAIDGALEAWAVELEDARRRAAAAQVGSDVPFFLAGGPALFEGRGEVVTPLPWLRDIDDVAGPTAPHVLIVTPAVAIRTADVFAAFAAITSGAGSGSTRLASDHVAAELRSGLRATDLLARAGVLASANDLAAAAAIVEPGLVPFRRAVTRLLRRPVGLSGSGPTLWALYPSLASAEEAARATREALAAGGLVTPGGSATVAVA